MNVEIRVEQEEVESIEIALRALHAERQCLTRYGLHSGGLSVAIDDLEEFLARIQYQQQQHAAVERDSFSRRVGLRAVRS